MTTTEAVATAPTPATAPPKRRLDKLPASFLTTLAEQHYRWWFVNLRDAAPHGVFDLRDITIEQIFDPSFWSAHIAPNKLNQFDVIRVVGGHEGTRTAFDVLLTVESKTGLGAFMKPFAYVPADFRIAEELDIVAAGNGMGDLRQKTADMMGGVSRMNKTGGAA